MTFLARIFGSKQEAAALRPLYDMVVANGRDPAWYREGEVPDTIDGRFDMVASLRQIGIGDFVVGKHIGKMMGALGGRLGAFRSAADPKAQALAVRRNIFRETPPSEEKVAWVAERLRAFEARLRATSLAELLEGRLK